MGKAGSVLLGLLLLSGVCPADTRQPLIEKAVLEQIASDDFRMRRTDRRCRERATYRVCLIDNFEQTVTLVPEVATSHGEMLLKLLVSGRPDIEVRTFNTSLSKGLALVLRELLDGGCVDAVVSSTPGSNYTYDQISSLFSHRVQIRPDNITTYQVALQQLLNRIAFSGFPSVRWLEQLDVNSVKLRNDATKFAFIEALGRFDVPVILPYGNTDVAHKGKKKSVNILSLSANAMVFSGLDREGNRFAGFPYSPLSSGDERAVASIRECPDPEDPFKARLDINGDGHHDYTFTRTGKIAYRDDREVLFFAPPVLSRQKFTGWLQDRKEAFGCRIEEEVVLTAGQYRKLQRACPERPPVPAGRKAYVWLNSSRHGPFYPFEARCWNRGSLRGTSLIPPGVVQRMLPPKGKIVH